MFFNVCFWTWTPTLVSTGLKDYFGKQYAGQKDDKDIQTLIFGPKRFSKICPVGERSWKLLKDGLLSWDDGVFFSFIFGQIVVLLDRQGRDPVVNLKPSAFGGSLAPGITASDPLAPIS